MTTPITDNWIADQEAICEKATEGPWCWSDFTVDQNKGGTTYTCYVHDSGDETEIAAFGLGSRMVRHGAEEDDPDWEAEVQARDNATFAASARTALPLALAELRRLREICEAWRLMDAAWPARVAETPEQIRAYRRLEAALAARERGE